MSFVLQDPKHKFHEAISRADMWALMAIWAVNRTISLNNDDCASCAQSPDLSTEFLWGRVGYNSVLQPQQG